MPPTHKDLVKKVLKIIQDTEIFTLGFSARSSWVFSFTKKDGKRLIFVDYETSN